MRHDHFALSAIIPKQIYLSGSTIFAGAFQQIFSELQKEGNRYEVVLGLLSHLQNFLRPFAHVEVVSLFSVDWVWSATEMVRGK